jgi:transposase
MINGFAGKVRKTGFFQKAGNSERIFGIYYRHEQTCRVLTDRHWRRGSHPSTCRRGLKEGYEAEVLKDMRNFNRQDDRLWDRYRRRYIVERTFSRFGNFRRLVVRYEHQVGMYVAFIQFSCVMMVKKRL